MILLTLLMSLVYAHPVIYTGGFVLHGEYESDRSTEMVSYTFHRHFAVQTKTSYRERLDGYRDYTVGFNSLVKRWLGNDSQGNIYASANMGYYKDDSRDGISGDLHLMGDWESRKYYTAGGVMTHVYAGDFKEHYRYRFGVAPYVAGMDTLQTWTILELSYFPSVDRRIEITPMLRFFYKNVLWEIGHRSQGEVFLTLMAHY